MSSEPAAVALTLPDEVALSTEVTITITPRVDGIYNYVIDYYPKRRNDTKVFHTATPGLENPSKPRQVLWFIDGLEAGQTVVIKSKFPVASDKFKQSEYRISLPQNAILSGPAKHHPSAGVPDLWQYSIYLKDADDHDLAEFIDPMVVIETDP